ncbi:MAG: PadR family transcriptional regulator [Holophagae bacterium]
MGDSRTLGDFEQLVVLALLRIGDGAYGMIVRREIEDRTGREVSLGAIYATLDRLEDKGLVRSTLGAADHARRGRAKRFFTVEPSGREALRRSLDALDSMRSGIAGFDPCGEVHP